MPGPRRAKAAAAVAIKTTNPKRRRLNPGADTLPVNSPESAARNANVDGIPTPASVANDAVLDESMAHSSTSSVIEFLNGWDAKSIQPGRRLQAMLLHDGQDQAHPALQYTRGFNWSAEDEARAGALWQAEAQQWKMGDMHTYLKLWKVCLQFADCSPWDIVGERARLRFFSSSNLRVDTYRMWSKDFCLALLELIPHIIWPRQFDGAHAMSITAAIQYAVILGTNDRRPWDPAPNSSDILYKMMRKCTDETSMRTRHEMVRMHCAERQIHLSVMSSIFLALEAEVITPQSRFRASSDGLYSVTTKDLLAVSNALNKMYAPRIGTLGYLPTNLQLAAAIEARPGRTFPKMSHLPDLHEAAMREEMRRRIERQRESQHCESERGRPSQESNRPSQHQRIEGGQSRPSQPRQSEGELGRSAQHLESAGEHGRQSQQPGESELDRRRRRSINQNETGDDDDSEIDWTLEQLDTLQQRLKHVRRHRPNANGGEVNRILEQMGALQANMKLVNQRAQNCRLGLSIQPGHVQDLDAEGFGVFGGPSSPRSDSGNADAHESGHSSQPSLQPSLGLVSADEESLRARSLELGVESEIAESLTGRLATDWRRASSLELGV